MSSTEDKTLENIKMIPYYKFVYALSIGKSLDDIFQEIKDTKKERLKDDSRNSEIPLEEL